MCSSMCMHLSAHAPFACTRMCAWGSFDASLSGLARFALFVFNDASREADSRRVERTAFDVSDYDITDVQPRRAEEWGSVLSVFFFFSLPSGILFRKKEGGRDRDTHTERGGEIKYLAKTRMRFCVHTKCAANWCFCLCCYCLTRTKRYRHENNLFFFFKEFCLNIFKGNKLYLPSHAIW